MSFRPFRAVFHERFVIRHLGSMRLRVVLNVFLLEAKLLRGVEDEHLHAGISRDFFAGQF